jgi:hypothetical protein
MNGKRKALAGLAIIAITLPTTALAQTIDTTPLWNGTFGLDSWDASSTPSLGQTVLSPSGATTLDSFSFNVAGSSGDFSANYRAYVYEWDGTNNHLSGSALWDSGPLSVGPVTQGSYSTLSFSPNIAISGSTTYMLFVSTIDETQPQGGNDALFGVVGTGNNSSPSVYADGQLYFSLDTLFSDLSVNGWNSMGNLSQSSAGADAAFTASFSAPEPGTVSLLALAVPGLVAIARRRRS